MSFYGSSTTTIYVNSNGSVSLMNGDTSFAANASAFISGPPRVAGHWSDLAPHVGGTVEWTQSCGDTVVRFTGVPEVGAPSETTTFHVSFLSGGSVTIDNAMVTPGWTTDSLVGFTPGAAVGGRVVNFSGLVGSTFAPPVGHAVFEHVPGGAPSPFGSITLTASGDLVVN